MDFCLEPNLDFGLKKTIALGPKAKRTPNKTEKGSKRRRGASVHFAFRLQDGNLPLLAAFPQLLRRSFVRCYGQAARIGVLSAEPAAGEQDLWRRQVGEDRPLPDFGTADVGLGDS